MLLSVTGRRRPTLQLVQKAVVSERAAKYTVHSFRERRSSSLLQKQLLQPRGLTGCTQGLLWGLRPAEKSFSVIVSVFCHVLVCAQYLQQKLLVTFRPTWWFGLKIHRFTTLNMFQ